LSPKARNWHKKFLEYTYDIARHENYEGMPDAYKDDGFVRWVVTGKSETGKRRKEWWAQKRDELGVRKEGQWPSRTSRVNHPTGKKPCQICGRVLRVDYVYPTKNTIKRLNNEFQRDTDFAFVDLLEISEILTILFKEFEETDALEGIARVFRIPSDIDRSRSECLEFILANPTARLSPGVMSNCPDRFDGFHTYNLCCRAREDTGRHADNLARYGEDRRVYEYWSDGNWKASAWLMQRINGVGQSGVCSICGKRGRVTADHLGPISLGFSLGDEPILRPACRSCNSGRNNRMNLSDLEEIREYEKTGIEVTSWHTRHIWSSLRNLPRTDEDAKRVGRLMRTNLHYVLMMLAKIADSGHKDFLVQRFLHPENANYSYDFENFDPITGTYSRMIRRPGTLTQYRRNAKRYERKSLEALEGYRQKQGRKIPKTRLRAVDRWADAIIAILDSDSQEAAMAALEKALSIFADWALNEYELQSSEA
jgi:Alw26I/Eco31I/Esp3I family type II restriction endonuclease